MHTWACSCTATVRKFIFSAAGKLKVEYFIFICVQQGFWYQQDWIFVSCCKSVQSVPGFAPDFDSLIFARCELTLRVRFCPAFGFVLPLGLSGIAEVAAALSALAFLQRLWSLKAGPCMSSGVALCESLARSCGLPRVHKPAQEQMSAADTDFSV